MAERKRCSSCGQTIAWHSIRGLRAYCRGGGFAAEFDRAEVFDMKSALGNATPRDYTTLERWRAIEAERSRDRSDA